MSEQQTDMIEYEEWMQWLEEEIKRAGSQHRLARRTGLTQQTIHQVLKGSIPPPPRLIEALGWKKRVFYEKATVGK